MKQSQKLKKLAERIDNALDNSDVQSLKNILKKITENNYKKEFSDLDKATLYFFTANIYSGIRESNFDNNAWDWNNIDLIEEIYNLRKSSAIFNLNLKPIKNDLKFRANTNLANALSHIGRPNEALEIFNNVLREKPDFAMANANKGHCLKYYASLLYDKNHGALFLYDAYKFMKIALKQGVETHAVKGIKKECEQIKSLINLEEFNFTPRVESRGRSKLEKEYRTWAIDNRLFLNPLNDLKTWDIVANDCLTPPNIVVPLKNSHNTPEVYGIYNQLKQEYISARYIIFEAIKMPEYNPHFSDKRVLLYDMLDFRIYGLSIEKIKMAFLSTYAIFDKIAYLINEYWKLGFNVKDISFNKIWFNELKRDKGLSDIFLNSENLPLRGLYWISRDLYKMDNHITEPNSKKINKIRNHISHQYLKVYDDSFYNESNKQQNVPYSISNKELEEQAIKLLKLARNALTYVSLAIYINECKNKSKKLVLPMPLYPIKK